MTLNSEMVGVLCGAEEYFLGRGSTYYITALAE
jgi:hypothetical protein